jgi:hypothetical protein
MASRRWWLLAPAAVCLLTALPVASQDSRTAGRRGPDAKSAADLAEVRTRWLPALVLQRRLVGQLDQLDELARLAGEADSFLYAIDLSDDLHVEMVDEIEQAGPAALGAAESRALLAELNAWFEEARRQAAKKNWYRTRFKMAQAHSAPASPVPPDNTVERQLAEELERRFVTLRVKLEDGAWHAQTAIDDALAAAITRLDEEREHPRSP